ncbi:unnamed protein product [Notodromas monacha]|uniref:Uncharacterized protein n=1 Tax=Notodromas monacha TaxID=399045 RepID=A0A7R9GAH3_9CRUS|nr:unnamed protein product [Notodromas monacha]CAG0914089.1 unnamed protein product [Notodromas monacha]
MARDHLVLSRLQRRNGKANFLGFGPKEKVRDGCIGRKEQKHCRRALIILLSGRIFWSLDGELIRACGVD